MIRVMHERCHFEASETDRYGDKVWVRKASNVPCEMVPQSSAEKNVEGVALTTADYLFVTRSTIIPANQTTWRIVWRGRHWSVIGFLEDHHLRGRLQHREGVVKSIPVS